VGHHWRIARLNGSPLIVRPVLLLVGPGRGAAPRLRRLPLRGRDTLAAGTLGFGLTWGRGRDSLSG
jgi:hypothetical protein